MTFVPDNSLIMPSTPNSRLRASYGGNSIGCGEFILTVPTVPTLSQWGLIAMAGILGIIGFMVIRRRKVTA